MQPSPETRPSLLARIRDSGDALAWGLFVEVYAPLIHGYLRKRGLQDADAADITQDVLGRVSQAIERFEYDPKRGAFRGWLFTIVRNRLRTFLERKHERGSGDSATMQLLLDLPAIDEREDPGWDAEYRGRLFRWAGRKVQADVHETTWKAFWLTSMEDKTGQEVARQLGMSVAAVYVARSRVIARLREIVLELSEPERQRRADDVSDVISNTSRGTESHA